MAATLASPESAGAGWRAVKKHALGARTVRVAAASAALLVLTNGPVLLFSKRVLDRTGRWEDAAVWPWLAAAAACGAALAAWDLLGSPRRRLDSTERIAAVASGWFALAALASSLWSVDPHATAWRSSIYVGMALLAWAVARFDARDTAATIAVMSAAAVGASLLLVALRPDLGLDPNDYWRGVYTNRNSLAPLAAIGVLVGVRFVVASGRLRRVAAALLVAGSAAALVGAGSRTAWVALAAAVAVSVLPLAFWWLRRRWDARRAAWVCLAAAGAGLAGAAAALAAVWNEPTFHQRRTIWGLVWDRILERPLGGHGFFTFWDIEELTQHALLRRGSAHNSLVEVGLGLGVLGVVPFVAILVLAARNAGLAVWRRPSADTWMWAALVAFLLVENVTESFVLWFSYSWVLLMAAALRPAPPEPVPPEPVPPEPVPPEPPAAQPGSSRGRRIGRLRSGWTGVAVLSLAVLAVWLPDLNLPLGNSDDGRILAFSGLKAHNFWDLGPLESDWGARVDPFVRAEFDVAPGTDPPAEAVTYAHHPPLKDWLSIVSAGLLGDSLAALRIPAFLMGAATLAFMASLLRACGLRWGPVLLAIGAMACTGFFYVYGRLGVSFSLLVACAAAVAWLRPIDRPPRWALIGTGALAALAAMHSWIGLVSLGPLAAWLFASRLQRGGPSGRGLPLRGRLARGWSASVTALVVGAVVGAAVTAAWMLSASGLSELVDRFAFRFGNDVSTAAEQHRFGFGQFLSRQWSFATEELLVPPWLRILLVPALVAGLVDKRTRVCTAITLALAAALTFGLQQGAWIHRLWNFPWLVPTTIGLAALLDRARRMVPERLRTAAAIAGGAALAATLLAVAAGSTRDRYISDPADLGEALEQAAAASEARQAEVAWTGPGLPTPRWASYYLDVPVWDLEQSRLHELDQSDLVILRASRAPEFVPVDALDDPLAAAGDFRVITAGSLLP